MNGKAGLNYSQQDKLFDPTLARPVHLIGAGSVGSHVANNLARIGVTDLTVWDDDSVDSHNIGPSLYGMDDFGCYKVDALARILLRDTGMRITPMRKKYEGEKLRGTVVCSVDNMDARQLIWKSVRKQLFVDFLVDTRVAERFFQLFTVRPCNELDITEYEPFLAYKTEEASRAMCGNHSIIFMASRVGALAVEALSDFWASGRTEFVRLEQLGSNVFIHPTQEH